MAKIFFTGSRSIKDYEFIERNLNKLIIKEKDTLINSGEKIGVDNFVKEWCNKNKVKIIILPAIYPENKFYVRHRNAEIIGMCDKCIIFFDKNRALIKFTIDYATLRNKPTMIFKQKNIII